MFLHNKTLSAFNIRTLSNLWIPVSTFAHKQNSTIKAMEPESRLPRFKSWPQLARQILTSPCPVPHLENVNSSYSCVRIKWVNTFKVFIREPSLWKAHSFSVSHCYYCFIILPSKCLGLRLVISKCLPPKYCLSTVYNKWLYLKLDVFRRYLTWRSLPIRIQQLLLKRILGQR